MNILIIGVTNPAGQELVRNLSCLNYNIFYLHYREITCAISEHQNPIRYDFVLSVAPIWHLSALLRSHDIIFNNIISLSSTSLLTKTSSNLKTDQELVFNFQSGENDVHNLCSSMDASHLFLRTTMLWGNGYDKNISTLIKFCRRFHFLPYFPPSTGTRSPIHYAYLAKAIVSIMHSFDNYHDFLILKGNQSLSLREILQVICARNKSFLLPIYVPLSLLVKVNKILNSRFR